MQEQLRTTTQIFVDHYGKSMTRMWVIEKVDGALKQVMSEFPTDPTQIRKPRIEALYKPSVDLRTIAHGQKVGPLK